MTDGDERRRDERYPVSLRVDYDDADDLVADYTENLSNGGTCVAGTRMLDDGTDVRLTLSFPGLIAPITLDGVVRWAKPGDGILLGIEFTAGPAREQLAEVVARIRARDPAFVKRTVRVLVVEDNQHVAELLRAGLGNKAGLGPALAVDCRMASDGREALALLHEHTFDALIVDMYLPVLDGAALIGMIRKDLLLTTLPIVAMSAGGDPAQRAAMTAGADVFIDKPIQLNVVLDKIRELVRVDAPR